MPTILFRNIFFLYKLLNTFLLHFLPTKLQPSTKTTHSSPPPPPPPRHMDTDELQRVFEMFDTNGDGKITKSELSDSLDKMGILAVEPELDQMIARVDGDGDGCVDIEEFGALYETIMDEERGEGGGKEDDMREAFNVFDRNGDGFITAEELRTALAALGLKQGKTAEDCRKMIMTVDVDGDGRVDFLEFKQMLKGGFTALG